jgi:hypothetical protein
LADRDKKCANENHSQAILATAGESMYRIAYMGGAEAYMFGPTCWNSCKCNANQNTLGNMLALGLAFMRMHLGIGDCKKLAFGQTTCCFKCLQYFRALTSPMLTTGSGTLDHLFNKKLMKLPKTSGPRRRRCSRAREQPKSCNTRREHLLVAKMLASQ